jgi:hypothetical protein
MPECAIAACSLSHTYSNFLLVERASTSIRLRQQVHVQQLALSLTAKGARKKWYLLYAHKAFTHARRLIVLEEGVYSHSRHYTAVLSFSVAPPAAAVVASAQ